MFVQENAATRLVNQSFLILILLVSGDVSANPGPASGQDQCQVCAREVEQGQREVASDG